ncbi:EAL domain-containing protein [Undibacterium sp. Jales W-56]|uniref:EAL domain-containing protein n=1 Tax=Undibacterium sp. Jales W-56 TaxID=2897325 RepID=UPI0021CEB724|nr:EAL domain-containing protein [Undibacterium sp. Jales W-56]MCU6435689.1 EAL domain-containing protein [Undibacterium sp. Jales W-56]
MRGQIMRVQGSLQDIDSQKRAEQDRLQTIARLERIADRVPGLIYEFRLRPDGTSCVPYANDYIRTIFKLTPDAVLEDASPALNMVHQDDMEAFQDSIQWSAKHFLPWSHEFRIQHEDGQIVWLSGNATIQKEADGSVLWHGFITDITESRSSQEQLKLLETSVSRLNDIVMITEAEPWDEPGPRILFVNDAFEKKTGYRREEVIGKSPRLLQGINTQRLELARIRAAMQQWEPVRAELINYTKTGEEYWVELDIIPVADAKGRFTHWISVERDITQRKQAELDLSRLNRALMLRSALSQYVIDSSSEPDLLEKVCSLAIDVGGYCLAWVGYKREDAYKSIQPVVAVGASKDYIYGIKLSWSEQVPEGCGPAGRTARSGLPVICEDFTKDSSFAPWVKRAHAFNLSGVVTLPLTHQNKTFGVLSLFLQDVRSLAPEEVNLLHALADDLAFGVMMIRARNEQQRVQSAVLKVAASIPIGTDTRFFEQLASNMADAVSADCAFLSRILPDLPLTARSLGAVLDGKIMPNFDYPVHGSPCENLLSDQECVINEGLSQLFPDAAFLQSLGAQAYIGRNLFDAAGASIGFIVLLFRQPLADSGFITSTLKIFATRAAAELERQSADQQIRQQASLLDKAQDAIIVRNLDHVITFWNNSAERLYGWTAAEAIQNRIDQLLYDDPTDFYRATSHLIQHGEWSGEIHQKKKDGSILVVEGHWTLVRDEQDQPQSILAINTDITARKLAENAIQQLAFYDPLTKLPNRQLLIDRLKQAIAVSARHKKMSAVLFIDLDNFKTLNDTLGHDFGDLLLQEVARRLTLCVRDTDTVARLGGDEFVVMLVDLNEHLWHAADEAKIVVEKILRKLNEPYHLSDHEICSTPSIGVTLIDDHEHSVEDVLKQADLAMYQSKAAGRNTFCFFDAAMQREIIHKVALESDLRKALQHREFRLYYQPQVDHTGRVIGAEALIRWIHPERGMVGPALFIPVAEETRLIVQIGRWVLEVACAQIAAWSRQAETSHLSLAVNVSAHQFHQPDFVQQVLQVLAHSGADPKKLKIELTESLLVNNVDDIIEKMSALKSKGVGFSLDDFGTGYSSLSYLKRLPLDQLKIDQSFVRDILTDSNDASIATTIIALAKSLGLGVIAEGVEKEEQRDFLRRNGCPEYQGFLYSKAIPIDEFQIYLQQSNLASANLII